MILNPVNPWLQRYRPLPDPALRLLCLPYAGAGANVFRAWPDALQAHAEVLAVQLPGRETRMQEAPITCMKTLMSQLLPAVLPWLDRDFVLFGHSMGALIAFELAHALRLRGLRMPKHLIVSGHRAPQLLRARRELHTLPQAEFLAELRSLGGTPNELLENPELMDYLTPRLRADFAVCETWRYRETAALDCPITALAGEQDELGVGALEAWRAQTRGDFRAQRFPGGHFYLQTHPELLLAAIRAELCVLDGAPRNGASKLVQYAHG